MYILRIGKNMIHQGKLSGVVSSLPIQYSICNLVEPLGKSRHISLSEIKNISRWSMAIIDFFSSFWNIPNRIETISRKYHHIIISQESSLLDTSILEDRMPESLCKNRLPKSYHLPRESEFSWIKTSLRKKSRYEISIKCFRHQSHKSLSSTTIEKCIMEDSNFWKSSPVKRGCLKDRRVFWILFWFFFHTKRILN